MVDSTQDRTQVGSCYNATVTIYQKKVQIMARKGLDSTALLRSVCVLFLLVCILFSMLPHTHRCEQHDCPLCVLNHSFSGILLAVCFFGILPVGVCSVAYFTYVLGQPAPQTLVHLKVKLSD